MKFEINSLKIFTWIDLINKYYNLYIQRYNFKIQGDFDRPRFLNTNKI